MHWKAGKSGHERFPTFLVNASSVELKNGVVGFFLLIQTVHSEEHRDEEESII